MRKKLNAAGFWPGLNQNFQSRWFSVLILLQALIVAGMKAENEPQSTDTGSGAVVTSGQANLPVGFSQVVRGEGMLNAHTFIWTGNVWRIDRPVVGYQGDLIKDAENCLLQPHPLFPAGSIVAIDSKGFVYVIPLGLDLRPAAIQPGQYKPLTDIPCPAGFQERFEGESASAGLTFAWDNQQGGWVGSGQIDPPKETAGAAIVGELIAAGRIPKGASVDFSGGLLVIRQAIPMRGPPPEGYRARVKGGGHLSQFMFNWTGNGWRSDRPLRDYGGDAQKDAEASLLKTSGNFPKGSSVQIQGGYIYVIP